MSLCKRYNKMIFSHLSILLRVTFYVSLGKMSIFHETTFEYLNHLAQYCVSYRNQLLDSLSYRNQSIDLLCKSLNWFLYDRETHDWFLHKTQYCDEMGEPVICRWRENEILRRDIKY